MLEREIDKRRCRAIARGFGTTFLGGTITLGLIDLALLGTHAALNART